MSNRIGPTTVARLREQIMRLPPDDRDRLIRGVQVGSRQTVARSTHDALRRRLAIRDAEVLRLKQLLADADARLGAVVRRKPGPKYNASMREAFIVYLKARNEMGATYESLHPLMTKLAARCGLRRFGNPKSLPTAVSRERGKIKNFDAKVAWMVDHLQRTGVKRPVA